MTGPTITIFHLSEQDEGILEVSEGDVLVIELPENPTTGFRWEVEEAGPDLDVQFDEFELDPEPEFGSGGRHRWRVVVRGRDPGRLTLQHWQSWEGPDSTTRRWSIDLRSRG